MWISVHTHRILCWEHMAGLFLPFFYFSWGFGVFVGFWFFVFFVEAAVLWGILSPLAELAIENQTQTEKMRALLLAELENIWRVVLYDSGNELIVGVFFNQEKAIKVCSALVCGKIISLIEFPLKTPISFLSSVMNSLLFPVFRTEGRIGPPEKSSFPASWISLYICLPTCWFNFSLHSGPF